MSKFKITCSACKSFVELYNEIKTDMKVWGTDTYKSENHHKHYRWSLLIGMASIVFLYMFAQLGDTPILFQVFVGTLIAFAANFIREWYMAIKYKAPSSWRDVRFGTYGGFIGSLITAITISLIF